jgi:prepilin peptidase CpaA
LPVIAPGLPAQWNLSETIIVVLGVVVLVVAAYGDARKRLIPNVLTVAVAILGICRLIVIGDPIAASYTLIAASLLFLVTFVLFWRGIMGGGDVKLLTATVLLIGYHPVFVFLMIMCICGALLSLVMILMHFGPRIVAAAVKSQPSVPYGVAIATAAVIVLQLY